MARREKPGIVKRYHCGTDDLHRRLSAESLEYRRRAREVEYETRRFALRYAAEGLKTGIVRIPTVVHVLWNDPSHDYSLAYVQAAIDALNADFRLTNGDAVNIPPHFAPVAADTRIEFVLAARDPACNPTTGYESKFVTYQDVGAFSFIIKNSGLGLPPWPPQRYLNIWVVNLRESDGIVGYSNYPSSSWDDGIVVASWAFGVNATHADHPLNRCLTHEAGHWLNLRHIWETDGACSPDDQVADTPVQLGPTYTPTASIMPSCGNDLLGGNMYQNYMDYTDEHYRCMFTSGQALRMHAALSAQRTGILASDGLIPPDAPSTPDLWMQDCPDDDGSEPYAGAGSICDSDDIWIRNGTDGLAYQDHQNPVAGQVNTVYVRVRNRGCPAAGAQAGILHLYWAKASPSLSWPSPWDGLTTNPAPMGGEIGRGTSVSVVGGTQQIVSFPWLPPDPSLYSSFGADHAHFCLLARLEAGPGPAFGMTVPETGDLPANVRNNNNIVWKNLTVLTDQEREIFGDVVIGRFDRARQVARYGFEVPEGPGPTLFDWGFILVEARGRALDPWRDPQLRGEGFQRLDDGRLLLTRPGAWVAAPPMRRGQFGTLRLRFVPDRRGEGDLGARGLPIELTERDSKGRFLGGQHFLLKTGNPPVPRGDGDGFDGVDWVPLPKGCGCR